MPIFLAIPDLGGGGTALDGTTQLGPAFTFFVASLFDTSAFHFLIVACEATEPVRGQGENDNPICSRTQFKLPPFGIFAV
jgi:hypothetical protein